MDSIKKYLSLMVVIISLITIISGLLQLISPAFVLGFIGAEITSTSSHLFAIVGMFMALFGSLMLHTIYSAHTSQEAILWCSLQKLGAFVAVSLGVLKGLFALIAIGVAVFDLFSGILFLYFLKIIKEP
ncbi:MAG: patatin [Cyclobacteriaceae bacterium]